MTTIRGSFIVNAWMNVRMLSQSSTISSVASRAVVDFSIFMSLASLVSYSLDPLVMSLSNYSVAYSNPRSDILKVNVLRSSPIAISPLSTTTSVRNGGRRAEFSATQLRSFFDLKRVLTAARRKNVWFGDGYCCQQYQRRTHNWLSPRSGIWAIPPSKKAATVYLREFFPTYKYAYVIWTSPFIVLLVSRVTFGKSTHTHFKLDMDGSSNLIYSCIKWIVQL